MEQVADSATWRLPLTECFRFGPGIATDASIVLNQLKDDPVALVGRGNPNIELSSFAVLARTNATLIGAAVDKASDGMPIHFSATTASEGWDPFVPYKFQLTLDIYRLWSGQSHLVRDPYMKKFKSFAEVEEHARGEDEQRHGRDIELALQVELVKDRGHDVPGLLNLLRSQSYGPDESTLTFSTVHRAKGQEWDAVHLLDDFIDPNDTELLKALDPVVRTEESNILYVAVTRAKAKVLYPQHLSNWFACCTNPGADASHRLPPRPTAGRPTPSQPFQPDSAPTDAIADAIAALPLRKITRELNARRQKIRQRHPRAYEPWDRKEDDLLIAAWQIERDLPTLAALFQRQPGAIRSRLQRLEVSR